MEYRFQARTGNTRISLTVANGSNLSTIYIVSGQIRPVIRILISKAREFSITGVSPVINNFSYRDPKIL